MLGETRIGFRFTYDDFCDIVGSQTSCWKNGIETSNGLVAVSETIDSDNYIISIQTGGTITNTYHFGSYSDIEIEIVQSSGINPKYVKQ
ncbi:hypothetical protein F6U93_08385 [Tamlana haliotis]|uniref:Uncharacterized protein n=1 Tax=Pseudotamlana haliotis TaxID=2614804 RepID=A0A6N6ME06_9FLAO|nr:hypothetical protein [Tamlana haliotis]KAB1067949.1 hypothetical protein F6U93_08385 [Tamlana haliotis]